jgi:hypothetical protein
MNSMLPWWPSLQDVTLHPGDIFEVILNPPIPVDTMTFANTRRFVVQTGFAIASAAW